MSKRKWTNEQFILAVETSLSYAEVIRKLGLKPAGSNYDTVKRKIKELDLNISHMICGFDSHLRYYSDGHYDHAGSTPALGTISN